MSRYVRVTSDMSDAILRALKRIENSLNSENDEDIITLYTKTKYPDEDNYVLWSIENKSGLTIRHFSTLSAHGNHTITVKQLKKLKEYNERNKVLLDAKYARMKSERIRHGEDTSYYNLWPDNDY